MRKLTFIITSFFLLIPAAMAQDGMNFNFQGRLLGSNGSPVPDGNYSMTFRIYSDSIGGNLLWSETHPYLRTSGGLFNAQLGSLNACSLGVLGAERLFLETRIGILPLSNRIPLHSTPRAAAAQRIAGDLITYPGLIHIFDPDDSTDDVPLATIGASGGVGSIKMFDPQPEPPGIWNPLITMDGNPEGGEFEFYAPTAGGAVLVNRNPQIKMRCTGDRSDLLLQRAWGGGASPSDSSGIYLSSDSLESNIDLFGDGLTKLQMGSNQTGGFSRFFTGGSEYMGVEPSPFNEGGNLRMYDAGETSFVISSSGKMGVGTASTNNIITVQPGSSTDPIADAWTVYSSRRWKTNILPIQGALDKVLRLNGVTYDWIEDGKHDIGLIAEDVGQVVPEIVAYEENGVDAKSVDYARLTALLIEAVKEQQKTIEQLKSEIDQLKIR